jgi:ribonuclease PH
MLDEKKIKKDPLIGQLASISVGIYKGEPVLDLDYPEDSNAETDMNVVMNNAGHFIEVQGTAEGHAYSRDEMNAMLDLAEKGINEIIVVQDEVLKS